MTGPPGWREFGHRSCQVNSLHAVSFWHCPLRFGSLLSSYRSCLPISLSFISTPRLPRPLVSISSPLLHVSPLPLFTPVSFHQLSTAFPSQNLLLCTRSLSRMFSFRSLPSTHITCYLHSHLSLPNTVTPHSLSLSISPHSPLSTEPLLSYLYSCPSHRLFRISCP